MVFPEEMEEGTFYQETWESDRIFLLLKKKREEFIWLNDKGKVRAFPILKIFYVKKV